MNSRLITIIDQAVLSCPLKSNEKDYDPFPAQLATPTKDSIAS